jgi:hypothetical protein
MPPSLTGLKGRSRCAALQSSKSSIAESDGANYPTELVQNLMHDLRCTGTRFIHFYGIIVLYSFP